MKFLRAALPLGIILCGFALRLYAADTAWIIGDQTHMHGEGILLLDKLLAGNPSGLSAFTYDSSSGLLNPGLMVYVWGAVAAINRSQTFAILVNLIANTLAVAMVFALVHRTVGRNEAVIAALLAAINPWTIMLARGPWQPGQLEFCFTTVACLLIVGLVRKRPSWVLAGFSAASILMWTYLLVWGAVAMGVFASIVLFQRRLRSAILAGWAMCAASALIMIGFALVEGKLAGMRVFSGAMTVSGNGPAPALAAAFPLLRTVTAYEYVKTWVNPGLPLWAALNAANMLGAYAVIMLLGLGLLFAARALSSQRPAFRLWLVAWVWFLLPPVVFALLKVRVERLEIQAYYMLMTLPAGYLIVALCLRALRQGPGLRLTRDALTKATAVCVAVSVVFAGATSRAAAQTAYANNYSGTITYLSARSAAKIGSAWRALGCEVMHTTGIPTDQYWVASLWEYPQIIRNNTSTTNDSSTAWSITPGKRNCLMTDAFEPPVGAAIAPIPLHDGTTLPLYSSTGIAPTEVNMDWTVNLGWRLVRLDVPTAVQAGSSANVEHVWRIERLPQEPYETWYFVANVKLLSISSQTIAEYWGTSVEGYAWRVGDEIHSTMQLTAPANTPPGDYSLAITLFDPNQKRNAVYFSPQSPTEPIVVIKRPIRILPAS